jgi:hypothetical protein
LLTILLLSGRAEAEAKSPTFPLPVQCGFPNECYVQSHVDLDFRLDITNHASGINGLKRTNVSLRNSDIIDVACW